MPFSRLRHERRSAVAVLFAVMAIPIIGLVGLAVDYGFWNQCYASMSLAASGAALNAVKITAAANLVNDKKAIQEGVTAGQQWFMAQVGPASNAAHLPVSPPTVTMTTGATTTAQVVYTGTVPSIFGNLFTIARYPITIQAAAQVSTSPYLNVEIMLDNSPSMEIGATPNDIADMMYLTPCSLPGAIPSVGSTPAGQAYNSYACSSTYTYDGQLPAYKEGSCPIQTVSPLTKLGLLPSPPGLVPGNSGPACPNLAVKGGPTYTTGAPCAFACHFDTKDAINANNDYYGIARDSLSNYPTYCYQYPTGSQLGSCAITLRFDLVKNAVNYTIQQMQQDNISSINNLNVGVYWFANDVTQVYPSPTGTCAPSGGAPNNTLACQAGNDWATAQNSVGTPPVTKDGADTGIAPYTGGNGADTNIPASMKHLANQYLTAAGDGSTPTSPLKVLFLVTDGLADYGNRYMGPIDTSLCTTFKNMGYTIYVVYTPYYPLMNGFYLQNIYSVAEPAGTSQLSAGMANCSSDPNNDYIAADPTDQTSITTALNTFLKRALTSSARFTN